MVRGFGTILGLDIGTSAVRAAQVARTKGGIALTGFGQVALPPGAMVDGEISDSGAVSEAIAQLWKRTRFRIKRAVIGVANQRVVVRQVDLPYLEEKEFRSSLRFQVADLIPMAVESAQLDSQIIEDYVTEDQEHMMRVLLVAADTEMIETFIQSMNQANIQPAGVDLAPFAVARAISPAARGEVGVPGAEAIVDVGAGVTNIIVHHNGEARFARILLVGGEDITNALASSLDMDYEEAEAVKLDLAARAGPPEANSILEERVASLVDEIRGSLDYYSNQEDSEAISSLILTGGGSLTPGLPSKLQETLRVSVRMGRPLSEIDVSRSGLTVEQIEQVEPVASAAIGLAIGTTLK